MRETDSPQGPANEQLRPIDATVADSIGKTVIGLVHDPEEARAMAEVYDAVQDVHKDTEAKLASGQVYDEDKPYYLEEQRQKAELVGDWAAALGKLTDDQKSELATLTKTLAAEGAVQLERVADKRTGEITAKSISDYTRVVASARSESERISELKTEELKGRAPISQTSILQNRIDANSKNLSPDEMLALQEVIQDPKTTIGDALDTLKKAEQTYIIKPVDDDYATINLLLASVKHGQIPTREDLMSAAENNSGAIARAIRQEAKRQEEATEAREIQDDRYPFDVLHEGARNFDFTANEVSSDEMTAFRKRMRLERAHGGDRNLSSARNSDNSSAIRDLNAHIDAAAQS